MINAPKELRPNLDVYILPIVTRGDARVFAWGGGGKKWQMFRWALRPRPWKRRSAGGTQTLFFSTENFLWQNYYHKNGVGVFSVRDQADKQTTKTYDYKSYTLTEMLN